MIELLRYLEANGFTTYIASGGDRDFMRPVTEEIYGIPAERVIGSSNALSYQEDEHGRQRSCTWRSPTCSTTARPSRCGSGAVSAGVRSWPAATPTATSRCSTTRGGPPGPGLRLLVLHDDPEREFDYTAGAEKSLERAAATAGPWSASRTTGPRCSPTLAHDSRTGTAADSRLRLGRALELAVPLPAGLSPWMAARRSDRRVDGLGGAGPRGARLRLDRRRLPRRRPVRGTRAR